VPDSIIVSTTVDLSWDKLPGHLRFMERESDSKKGHFLKRFQIFRYYLRPRLPEANMDTERPPYFASSKLYLEIFYAPQFPEGPWKQAPKKVYSKLRTHSISEHLQF
jgi:hypothetical protein